LAIPEPIPDLLKSANDASGRTFALWITFLTISTYLAIAIGTTTHVQLLLAGPVKLPLLGVDLPLISFYEAAPPSFVVLHLYVLVQLYLLARALRVFDRQLRQARMSAGERHIVRTQLDKFAFTQLLIAAPEATSIRWFLVIVVWFSFVVGPITLLLAFQVQFLPYHSVPIADVHRLTLLVDMLLLWLLWPRILRNTRSEGLARRYHVLWVCALGLASVAILVLSTFIFTIPKEALEKGRSWAGIADFHPVRSNMVIPTSASLIEPYRDKLSKVDRTVTLSPRDLRRASLIGVDLRKAYMREVDLREADLRSADLSSADLSSTNVSGSNLTRAVLVSADLNHANLSSANLAGANLRNANLSYANLTDADLTGADLTGANLISANLTYAHLTNTDLHGANLTATDLSYAHIISTGLSSAADLSQAQLDDACGNKRTELPLRLTIDQCP
jgi:hypothetical protein